MDSICGQGLAFQLSFDLDIDPITPSASYQRRRGRRWLRRRRAVIFGDIAPHRPWPTIASPLPDFQLPAALQWRNPVHAPRADLLALAVLRLTSAASMTIRCVAGAAVRKSAGNAVPARLLTAAEALIGSNEWVVVASTPSRRKPILFQTTCNPARTSRRCLAEQHVVPASRDLARHFDATGVIRARHPGHHPGLQPASLCNGTTTLLDVTDIFARPSVSTAIGCPIAIVQWMARDEAVESGCVPEFYVNQVGDGVADDPGATIPSATPAAVTVVSSSPQQRSGANISGSTGLSVAWRRFRRDLRAGVFRRINRAGNLTQFQDASYFDAGSQNFAYADVDGQHRPLCPPAKRRCTDLQTQNTAPGGGVPPWFIRDGSRTQARLVAVQHRQPNQALPYEILPASEMPHGPTGQRLLRQRQQRSHRLFAGQQCSTRCALAAAHYPTGGASVYRMGRIDRELQRLIASGNKITTADMKAQANNRLLDAPS